jgi:zinc transport system ATP-binding protein
MTAADEPGTGDGAMSTAVVEIDGVTIRRQRELVLDRVSLRVERGTLHVIVGPNGAGKSTLLSALLGQTAFDGRIALNWRHTGAIGYVPQSFPIDATLPVTVEDFLALTRQRRPVCLGIASATRRVIGDLLARVDLTGLERRPLAVLSGGELRRVLLAHALDPEPELLILDEPASGLDEPSAQRFERALTELKRAGRTTILMVSHDFDQVRRVADRVTLVDRRVLDEGTPGAVLGAAADIDRLSAHTERQVRR